MSKSGDGEECDECGTLMERIYENQCPALIGTRDGFGVGMEFYDHKTKKYITNYTDWEKAGYLDAMEHTTGDEKEQLKEHKARQKKKGKQKQIDMDKYKFLTGGGNGEG